MGISRSKYVNITSSLGLGFGLGISGGGDTPVPVDPPISPAEFLALVTDGGQLAVCDWLFFMNPQTQTVLDLTGTYTPVINGTMAWDTFGLRGDGVTGFLSGMPTTLAASKMLDASVHVFDFTTRQGNGRAHLGRSSGAGQLVYDPGPVTADGRPNSSAGANWSVENTIGASSLVRRTATPTLAELYRNKLSLGTRASVNVAKSASPLSAYRSNTVYSSDTMLLQGGGAELTASQISDLHGWAVRLAKYFGWSPLPAPVDLGVLPILSFAVHPDGNGSVTGKGITCTGLCPDVAGAGLWSGNDGRGDGADTTFDSGVRHYPSATNVSVFTDFYLASGALKTHFDSIGITDTSKYSVQGVAVNVSAGKVIFEAKDTVGTNGRLVTMDEDGSGVTSIPVNTNGVSYDPVQNLVGSVGTNLTWQNLAGALTPRAGGANQTSLRGIQYDQAWIDPTGTRLVLTGGSNGVPGTVQAWSLVNAWNTPFPLTTAKLAGALAIEGGCVIGSDIWANSDQFFHPAPTPSEQFNQLQRYSAAGLLAA